MMTYRDPCSENHGVSRFDADRRAREWAPWRRYGREAAEGQWVAIWGCGVEGGEFSCRTASLRAHIRQHEK